MILVNLAGIFLSGWAGFGVFVLASRAGYENNAVIFPSWVLAFVLYKIVVHKINRALQTADAHEDEPTTLRVETRPVVGKRTFAQAAADWERHVNDGTPF